MGPSDSTGAARQAASALAVEVPEGLQTLKDEAWESWLSLYENRLGLHGYQVAPEDLEFLRGHLPTLRVREAGLSSRHPDPCPEFELERWQTLAAIENDFLGLNPLTGDPLDAPSLYD